MTVTDRLIRDIKKDRETLKTLTFRQKIRFILDYYKGQMFALFVCLLFLFYIGDLLYQSSQIIDLQGFFINDRQNLFPAEELIEDFSAYQMCIRDRGYAVKFMRMLILVLTALFNYWGFAAGTIFSVCAVIFNRTIAGKSYIYPIIPFSWSELKKRFFRSRLPHTEKESAAK